MVALSALGIQLQTTRGISLSLSHKTPSIRIPLFTSSTFIPLEEISTIVIHEGLRGWRVEYYVAVIKRSGAGIVVGYEVI
jgi:hypothetical protein